MKHTSDTWRWLTAIETLAVDGEHAARTGAVETLLVVLDGCFDMFAGGGSWPARGVRTSPLAGKPVALFLPPETNYALRNGRGNILLVCGVQPEQEEAAGEAMVRKPLLALSGSQKAYDPKSGAWKDQEMFPSSPQALLPRHIEETAGEGAGQTAGQGAGQGAAGTAIVRRVFPASFKARCLSLDEIVLPAGSAAGVPRPDIPDYPVERALYYAAPGGIEVDGATLQGDGCVDIAADSRIVAAAADAYVAIASAGPKE